MDVEGDNMVNRLHVRNLYSFSLVFLLSEFITLVFRNSDNMAAEYKAFLRVTLMTWNQVTWNCIAKSYQFELGKKK